MDSQNNNVQKSKRSVRDDQIFQAIAAGLVGAGIGSASFLYANNTHPDTPQETDLPETNVTPQEEQTDKQETAQQETTEQPQAVKTEVHTVVKEIHHHHYHDNQGGSTGTKPKPQPHEPQNNHQIEVGKSIQANLGGKDVYAAPGTFDGKPCYYIDEDKDGKADKVVFVNDKNQVINEKTIDLHEEKIDVVIPKPEPPEPDPHRGIEMDNNSEYTEVQGQKVIICSGKIQGHDCVFIDRDGDLVADQVAVEIDGKVRIIPLSELGYSPEQCRMPEPEQEPEQEDVVVTSESFPVEINGKKVTGAYGTYNGKTCMLLDMNGNGKADVAVFQDNTVAKLNDSVDIAPVENTNLENTNLEDMHIVAVQTYEHAKDDNGQPYDIAKAVVTIDGKQHLAVLIDTNHDGEADQAAIDLNNDGKVQQNEVIVLQEHNIHISMDRLAALAGYQDENHPHGEPANDDEMIAQQMGRKLNDYTQQENKDLAQAETNQKDYNNRADVNRMESDRLGRQDINEDALDTDRNHETTRQAGVNPADKNDENVEEVIAEIDDGSEEVIPEINPETEEVIPEIDPETEEPEEIMPEDDDDEVVAEEDTDDEEPDSEEKEAAFDEDNDNEFFDDQE